MAEKKSKAKPKGAPPPAPVAEAPARRPVGRPSMYGEEVSDAICALILDGKSISQIGEIEGLPSAWTIHNWKNKHAEFSQKVARAREDREETMAFELIELGRSVRDRDVTREDLDKLRFEADQYERALRLLRSKNHKIDTDGAPLVQNNFVRVDARSLPEQARNALERVLIEAHPDLEGET
jgi:hypothetical protein